MLICLISTARATTITSAATKFLVCRGALQNQTIMTRTGGWFACTVLAAASLITTTRRTCTAFQSSLVHNSRHLPDTRNTILATTGSGSNDDAPSDDGEDLAGQFYDQLKKRRASADISTNGDEISQPVRRFTGPSPKDDISQTTKRRFTGASPSLFSEEQRPDSSNLEREREREFNLVGNFERTLGIQAVILLAFFIGIVSVGLSGGITDGSDRHFGGADDLEYGTMTPFQTDDAAEVEAMIQGQSALRGYELQSGGNAEEMDSQPTGESRWL